MAATFGSYNLQETDFSVHFDVRRGLKETAEYRGRNTVIPGADGEIPRTKVIDRLPIELYGWIQGSDWSDYWTLVKALLAAFDPAGGAQTLSVDLDDGTTATIDAVPLSVVPEGDEAIGATQYFSITLEALDPPSWNFA